MAKSKLQQLALDVYNGRKIMFDGKEQDGNEAIRNALIESVGGEWNFYNFQKNKWAFFQVMSEVLALPMEQTLEGMFDGILTQETIGLGEYKVIDVKKPELYKVATIAAGNNDIRRQRDFGKKLHVETDVLGIKIYEDFDRFIAGKIDFVDMINRAKKSMLAAVSEKVYECLSASFDAVARPKLNKTGAVSESALDEMIALVKGKTGLSVAIYGGNIALGKISTAVAQGAVVPVADSQKESYAQMGHFANYKGVPMIEMPTIVKDDEIRFADEFYVLPQMQDIIRVIFEGQPVVGEDTDPMTRNDRQIEFIMTERVGVVCLVTGYFGLWKTI